MLGWWQSRSVERADIAVRRASGAMIWHQELPIERLPLAWLRAENAQGAEIYIRPARGSAWPLVFLDDVDAQRAVAVVRKYAALAIRTSVAGGCHLWLACRRRLDEPERATVQRWIASRIHADPASTSGEHLGRLAGFRSWKRHGVWVNVLQASMTATPWDPAPALEAEGCTRLAQGRTRTDPPAATRLEVDSSPSGRDWAWVCSLLEAGHDASDLHRRLALSAAARRGHDAERYAARTIDRALQHLAAQPKHV